MVCDPNTYVGTLFVNFNPKFIYLTEDYGWVNAINEPVNLGTWNPKTRVATLNSSMDLMNYDFIIKVSNAVLDGQGATIGGVLTGLNITGQYNVKIKNITINESIFGIFVEYCQDINISNITINNSQTSIAVFSSKDCNLYKNNINCNLAYCTGMFIQNSKNIKIRNNEIYIQILTNTEGYYVDPYSGIALQLSVCIEIVNNNISISNGNVIPTNNSSTNVSAYCIVVYSTYGSIIRSNDLLIENNKFDSNSNEDFSVSFGGINLSANADANIIEANNISTSNNNLEVTSNSSSVNLYGILLMFQGNKNEIKNNKVDVINNTYNFNATSEMTTYTNFIGIIMSLYNNYNKVENNMVIVENNKSILQPLTNSATNNVLALYMNTGNIGNNIKNNEFILDKNVTSRGKFIYNSYSLINLYAANTSNTIHYNLLNNSQGNGITLVSQNDVTDILNNQIMNNKGYGILLSTINGNPSTNTSTIMYNSIVNNKDYGIYVIKANAYNHIKSNNIITSVDKTAYDENNPDTHPNYYCGNYWSNWNGIGPYIIQIALFKDNCPQSEPLKFNCNN